MFIRAIYVYDRSDCPIVWELLPSKCFELAFKPVKKMPTHTKRLVIQESNRNTSRHGTGNTVAVVTHGGLLSVIHRCCVGHSRTAPFQNCAYGEVLVAKGSRAVLRWNVSVVSHDGKNGFGGGTYG
jgi:hypothetical protein